MKTKLFPALLVVILVAAVFAFPVLAQGENPPVVDAPVFDWAGISSALQRLIIAFLVPSAGFLARWLFAMGSYKKAQLSEQQNYMIGVAFETFVFAAEQLKLSGYIENKLDWVVNRAEMYLVENNILMDLDSIRARVEAIVAQELNINKFVAPKSE